MNAVFEQTAQLATHVHAQIAGNTPESELEREARRIRDRLAEPLRIAIAGRVKAGKSTLLNALVGERLARTDAGECTQVVAWYRHGFQYRVEAVLADDERIDVLFHLDDGRLRFEPPIGVALDQIARFEISWPAGALRAMTLIDTPGLASLDDANSARSRDFLLADDDRPAQADVVLYAMRHLHSRDAEYLEALRDRSVGVRSAATAIAVLSRADEIGGGRPDAMTAAAQIAARYAADVRVRALCANVLPVTALLAETAATLTEAEVADLRALAIVAPDLLDVMMLAADELCSSIAPVDLPVENRRALLARFGMFGLRVVLGWLHADAAATAAEIAPRLVEVSGLPQVVRTLRDHFLPRTGTLKARVALTDLRGH